MKRSFVALAALGLVVATAVFAQRQSPPPAASELAVKVEERNPWNHLKLNNGPDSFQFVIVTDRTGGPRPGVFERAVDQVNLLEPEFVLSVGDLIQGGLEDPAKIDKQWEEFDGFIARLHMPFFYVPGNHDISNATMDKKWQDKFGRRYYHFVYKDVLFLLLNTEDPPRVPSGHFSAEQIAYARRVLEENAKVRWTIVAMHKPVWTYSDVAKTGWLEIEQALAGRKYTVFAGHKHKYQRFVRNGQKYYMLATTGGSSRMRGLPFGEFDHVVWVTMKKDGPVLANIMVEGIFPEDIPTNPRTEAPEKSVTKN